MISIRKFRKYPPSARRAVIARVPDPLALEILRAAFLGYRHRSWAYVAMRVGGGNSPDSVRMIAARALCHSEPCSFSDE